MNPTRRNVLQAGLLGSVATISSLPELEAAEDAKPEPFDLDEITVEALQDKMKAAG